MWRGRILPSQTLWYQVAAGWGQQVRYDVDFANEPTVHGSSSVLSYGATQVYTPARAPVGGGTAEFSPKSVYNGRPASVGLGTVPVAWTNRYESHPHVIPVHAKGSFYIAVTLGAKTADIAENPQIGLVLRVSVLGKELTGPQYGAPALGKDTSRPGTAGDRAADPAAHADSGVAGGAGWVAKAAAVGGGIVVIALVAVLVRARRRAAERNTRGSW